MLCENDHAPLIGPAPHMPPSARFAIVPLHPTSPDAVIVPRTLSQVNRMVAQAEGGLLAQKLPFYAATTDGRQLMDGLARLSARHATRHLACVSEMDPTQMVDLCVALNQAGGDLRLSITCNLGMTPLDDIEWDHCGSVVQIQWRITGPLPPLGFFKAFSRRGVWNHLQLESKRVDRQTCVAVTSQTNILHSWETSGGDNRSCLHVSNYDQVRPLAGRPLWQAVNDPISRFLLIDRLTKDRLVRLRIDEDGEHLFSIGANLAYHYVPPDQLPAGYLDEICAMVAAGGSVAPTHVRANIKRAHLVGYVEEKGCIVGNSSLKNPRPVYIDAVRRQSGLDLSGFLERGYTSVRPEYRGLGIGTKLLAGLTRRADGRKIFSVIGEDNPATQTIAVRNRTRKVATYFSQKAGKPVGIWMPEWLIDGGDRERR